jgi:predicted component of type VI protein secretion system
MQPEKAPQPEQQKPAVEHLSEAHRLLQGLREKLDKHPDLEQAIEQLEMALSILAVKTGGML